MKTDSKFSYHIDPRNAEVGGGYQLKLLEHGQEVGGGVFPVTSDTATDEAYLQAFDAAEEWLQSRKLDRSMAGANYGDPLDDAMIDIETLGKKPGAAVLSVGAVMFGAEGLGQSFYSPVLLQSCTDVGLTIDPETIGWWMKQSDKARAAAFVADAPRLPVVLQRFTDWFVTQQARYPWCHGATFDVPILDAAYEACEMPAPWKFYDVRDTRTLYDLAGVKVDRTRGTHHNALDDARAQAEAAVVALKRLQNAASLAPSAVPAPGEIMQVLPPWPEPISAAVHEKESIAPWLTDKQIVDALHSLGIDTEMSKYGFPDIQVQGTNVPNIRRLIGKLTGSTQVVQGEQFAWAAFAENGNVIIWSRRRDQVEPVATQYGRPVVPVIALSPALHDLRGDMIASDAT